MCPKENRLFEYCLDISVDYTESLFSLRACKGKYKILLLKKKMDLKSNLKLKPCGIKGMSSI